MATREMTAAATSGVVLAAHAWPTNAHLIADVARLGYLRPGDRILDPTFGLGRFWQQWRPDPEVGGSLVGTDLKPDRSDPAWGAVDFTRPPFPPRSFDAIVFDPPYKLNGARSGPSDDDYGVDEWATWQDRHALIRMGITALVPLLKRGTGRFLLKCQDQVCGGRVRWQTRDFADHAESCGVLLVDRFDLLGKHRPQPMVGRRQEHPHGRPSTLLVFTKPLTNESVRGT